MLTGRSLLDILLSIPAILVAITFHEFAHGYVAYKLGDPTAKYSGRLSFNPLRHFDPFGALMLLIVGFGWAKPVPVDTHYFKNPKKDMALVGLAGPLSNIIIAFIALFLQVKLNLRYNTIPGIIFQYIVILNIGLAIFNLIPIPPLDGSKIFNSILPDKIYYKILYYERYMIIILMVLLFTGILTPVLGTLVNSVFKTLFFIVNMIT